MSNQQYATMADRIAANAKRDNSKLHAGVGCMVWQGNVGNSGYARLSVRCCGKVKKVYAHRAAVEADGREIPEGMEVDHGCYNTLCVEPKHLEVVTPQVNKQRRRYH